VELIARVPTPIDRPPRILVMDDLHRTDDDTIRVLERLAEPPYPLTTLIIANYRVGQASSNLERLVHSVQALSGSDARFTHLRLHPLAPQEVAEIVEARVPTGRFKPEAVAEPTERCSGSPDLIEKTLERMLREGSFKPGKRGTSVVELPDDVGVDRMDGLEGALGSVSAELRATLRRAAVLGSRFSTALLARLEERDEIDVLEAFQSAHDRGVCPVEMMGDSWSFLNSDVVQVLRDELLPPLRAAYASKAARVLRSAQKRAPDSGLPRIYPGRIAALCEEADDFVGALAAHVEAAGNDETLLALESARYHLQRSRDLIAQGVSLPGTDANLRWHLAADHGRVLLALTGEIAQRISANVESTTEVQQGLILLNDALAEADAADADVRDQATLRATLAAALMFDPASRHEALTQIRRARTLLVVGGFPAQSWHFAGREADVLIELGDIPAALKTCQAALKYFRKEGADVPLAKADLAATLLRMASLFRGQLAPVGAADHESQRRSLEAALDEAGELLRSNQDHEGVARVHLERSRFLFHLAGETSVDAAERMHLLSDARKSVQQALGLMESCCAEADLSTAYRMMAEVQVKIGATEVATDGLRRAGLYRLADGERDLSDIFRSLDDLGGAAAERIKQELRAAGGIGA